MTDPNSKSPRDWLLARHARVTPQLDALRETVLSPLRAPPSSAANNAHATAPLDLTWRQLAIALFRPQRTLWATLAAAWLVVVALQLTRPHPSPSTTAATPSAEAIALWLRQSRSHEALAQIHRHP